MSVVVSVITRSGDGPIADLAMQRGLATELPIVLPVQQVAPTNDLERLSDKVKTKTKSHLYHAHVKTDLLRQLELVAAEGRDAGLDPSGAQGDQEQPDDGEGARRQTQGTDGGQREHHVAEGVDHRHVEDRVELAQPAVGDDRPEDREEVDEHGEGVVDDGRVALAVREDVVQVEGEDRWKLRDGG